MKNTSHRSLSDLPLWRLLVALDDAERTVGPGSTTVRVLARTILDRMRQDRAPITSDEKGKAGSDAR